MQFVLLPDIFLADWTDFHVQLLSETESVHNFILEFCI
jgi:hypothetical protein